MKQQPPVAAMIGIALFTGFGTLAAETSPEPPVPASAPQLRIATVDMQELFKQYHGTLEAQKQINVDRARVQKENNERLARVKQVQEQIELLGKQLEDPAVNEAKKNALFKDWQTRQQEGIALDRERREFSQRRTQALNEMMVRKMKGILEEIRKIVEEQAKLDNFDFVFDRSGLSSSQVPFMLYTKDSTDITAVLLKRINQGAPPESTGTQLDAGDTFKLETPR
jgi:Skp family chaperone for outer membrane proteins